jgi:hypothetical protein
MPSCCVFAYIICNIHDIVHLKTIIMLMLQLNKLVLLAGGWEVGPLVSTKPRTPRNTTLLEFRVFCGHIDKYGNYSKLHTIT